MIDGLRRRNFLTVASAGSMLATLNPLGLAGANAASGRSEKPLKAAFSNGGLQSSWCAQGKAAAEHWGKLFNVEVTWFDGGLDADKQRVAIDKMASQQWDFVAIQAQATGSLTEPVQKMIDAGIPVITMDTLIALDDEIHVFSHLGADNRAMGAAITQALITKLGGKGKIIMTPGPIEHTGAQDRTKGFTSVIQAYPGIEVLETQPGDWDVVKVARLWEDYLAEYPEIDAAFFHSDDMALAAYNVMKAHGRTSILIGGIDAMPPAIDAVFDGRMFATVRNPSCLIHGGAIIAGVAAATANETGGSRVPANIVTDGPIVTLEKADGMRWLQDQFLM
ncbi:sugar ABC transporter substrate-binding protein [Rhizobium mayense]|uniref:Sugar ABC transporter substrate-binding protein n=1 Tax=Rhizobium mayense TaxID=1312184 RepID=A0ABT7K5B5_9HYPH|nr:sugar ABC transporter substrate-binding protein [Rhizobium mayense]MDL2403809.1 sugar ABC transporter substrate-binding protein [Rhizobium mayense]